jgi:metal-sulfur cluster biosynthetic enzyme
MALVNPNPQIYAIAPRRVSVWDGDDLDEDREDIDALEIFEMIRDINDPEHPNTLEELRVLCLENIIVDDANSRITVLFTPTIPHCSMATLIGLCIHVKLHQCLPRRFKVTVLISPGSHETEDAINKQLNDKERVAAALEGNSLVSIVKKCLQRR